MARKVVKLLRKSGMYAPGEIAGFPESTANKMIERGIAEAYEPEPQKASSKRRRPRPGDGTAENEDAEDKQMRSRGAAPNYETK